MATLQEMLANVVSLSPWPTSGPLAALPGPLGGLVSSLQESLITLELDHEFSVEGEGGSSGGRRQAAAGSVVELRLEQVRRTLGGIGEEEDGAGDDEWVDMLNPEVRKKVRQQEQASSGSGNPLLDLIPKESSHDLGMVGSLAAGAFDTPYADGRVRISRGVGLTSPLQELRIFERIGVRRRRYTQVGRRRRMPWPRRLLVGRSWRRLTIVGRRAALMRRRRWTLTETMTMTAACPTRERRAFSDVSVCIDLCVLVLFSVLQILGYGLLILERQLLKLRLELCDPLQRRLLGRLLRLGSPLRILCQLLSGGHPTIQFIHRHACRTL